MTNKKLIFLICWLSTLVVVTAVSAEEKVVRTGWVSNSQYKKIFKDMADNRYYSHYAEGRLYKGYIQYRGVFKPYFKELKKWYAFHGMTEEKYWERSEWFSDRDYTELYKNEFMDSGGIKLINAAWVIVSEK